MPIIELNQGAPYTILRWVTSLTSIGASDENNTAHFEVCDDGMFSQIPKVSDFSIVGLRQLSRSSVPADRDNRIYNVIEFLGGPSYVG
jgi:hypothetical protein